MAFRWFRVMVVGWSWRSPSTKPSRIASGVHAHLVARELRGGEGLRVGLRDPAPDPENEFRMTVGCGGVWPEVGVRCSAGLILNLVQHDSA